jgi:hypothetical protein
MTFVSDLLQAAEWSSEAPAQTRLVVPFLTGLIRVRTTELIPNC